MVHLCIFTNPKSWTHSPINSLSVRLSVCLSGSAYGVKLFCLTTNFPENLCGGRSWGKLFLVLSKDLDWKSGSPRYWHLKNSHEASAIWCKKSELVARFWWKFVWWELMVKVNFGFKQSCHQNEQNTPILALENLKKWHMRRLAYEVKSLDR